MKKCRYTDKTQASWNAKSRSRATRARLIRRCQLGGLVGRSMRRELPRLSGLLWRAARMFLYRSSQQSQWPTFAGRAAESLLTVEGRRVGSHRWSS